MSKSYNKGFYYSLKTLSLPSLISSYIFGRELVNNISDYNAEQFILAGGATLLCGLTGLLGLFSKKKHFALEDSFNE